MLQHFAIEVHHLKRRLIFVRQRWIRRENGRTCVPKDTSSGASTPNHCWHGGAVSQSPGAIAGPKTRSRRGALPAIEPKCGCRARERRRSASRLRVPRLDFSRIYHLIVPDNKSTRIWRNEWEKATHFAGTVLRSHTGAPVPPQKKGRI